MKNKTGWILALCCAPLWGQVHAQKDTRTMSFEALEKYTLEAQSSHENRKLRDIERFRQQYAQTGYRMHSHRDCAGAIKADKMLQDDGIFTDLIAGEEKFFGIGVEEIYSQEEGLKDFISEAWNRIASIACETNKKNPAIQEIYTDRLLRAILHYGELEIKRPNLGRRFHESCFALPTAAMNTYYKFLPRMDEIEAGDKASQLEKDACRMLKVIALQAWTQPYRNDATDLDITSIPRFRKHVWWVGGNAIAYRSLMPIACMIKSVPMIDVLAEVFQKSISSTSQVTYDESFWTEGFTADGAGWGHGMQCLIWGYPIDGTSNSMQLMASLKGSQWEQKLDQQNKDALLNYLRGSNWYFYKGYVLPGLDRTTFTYVTQPKVIKASLLTNTISASWMDSFNNKEQRELKSLITAYKDSTHNISMKGYPNGHYNGMRWFFNNDDLIKKNDDYHVFVNLASRRVDGLESASHMADGFNFTTCDGTTLFQRKGDEYYQILGAYDVLRAPGITARIGMDQLKPIVNWGGYCSKHNFAGAAMIGAQDGCAGYVFEKMNTSFKENKNDTIGRVEDNRVLYGVQAHKSYFFMGDYMLAMGAGVTNLRPNQKGSIHTSIEQTAKIAPVYRLKQGKKEMLTAGKYTFQSTPKQLDWIMQEGKFAYTVLPEYSDHSFVSLEQRKTDWVKMSIKNRPMQARLPQVVDVLQVWTDHGHKPQEDTYGYLVYMGKGQPLENAPFTILSNSERIQAVCSNDKKRIQAVFYDPQAQLHVDGELLKVSHPCVVMLKEQKGMLEIALSDPQMNTKLHDITVSWRGKSFRMDLPQGEWTSSVVSKKFNL